MTSRSGLIRTALGLLVGALALSACEAAPVADDRPKAQASPEPPEESRPPVPFQLTAETKDVLYTWVDSEGNFQLTSDRAAIPESARRLVRVVVQGHPPGTPEHVYVADLSKPEDGRFPVQALTRKSWEEQGADARQRMLADLAPPRAPDDAPEGTLGITAIIYGADWCKPCHQAEAYLKKKGADVVKKDVEEDPAAAAEMHKKLKRAGMGGSSIPIIDVGGTIMVGFSPHALDAALARATGN